MESETLIKEVLAEYEHSLALPEQPERKRFLLCPVGLVGAGKTTVTKPLAERLSLVRISRDEIRKLLKERGEGYEVIEELTLILIHTYLGKGYSIAVDSDCAHPQTVELINPCAEEYGTLVFWIHIDPPEEFILHKLRSHEPTWLFKDAEEAVANYMRRKPLHESLPMPFLHAFDTSKPGLATEIEETARSIENLVR